MYVEPVVRRPSEAYTRERIDALVEDIRATDPDLVLAADEQDAQLLAWFSGLSAAERLDRAARMALELEQLRDGRRDG